MFRIKICGVTSIDAALGAAEAGADAVGLNFYAQSPRCVSTDQARAIIKALPAGVVKVGVFVNAGAAEVAETFDRLALDLVQLHGDEPPEFLAELGDRPVMRAFRVGPDGLGPAGQYLHRCRQLRCLPRMTLLDAFVPGQYGGAGRTADWMLVRKYPAAPWHPPLVLAGGLTPENVAEAILAVRPTAVDASSGVESRPGRKDPLAVAAFVRAAREAFEMA